MGLLAGFARLLCHLLGWLRPPRFTQSRASTWLAFCGLQGLWLEHLREDSGNQGSSGGPRPPAASDPPSNIMFCAGVNRERRSKADTGQMVMITLDILCGLAPFCICGAGIDGCGVPLRSIPQRRNANPNPCCMGMRCSMLLDNLCTHEKKGPFGRLFAFKPGLDGHFCLVP